MNTSLRHVLQAVGSTPWSITPEKLQAILGYLELRTAGLAVTLPTKAQSEDAPLLRPMPGRAGQAPSYVAVLPVMGVLSHRMNMMNAMSGEGTSTEMLGKVLAQALSNTEVAAIVLDIDSPGGSLEGTPELAAALAAARESKPVYGIANSMAASAAYYLLAACTKAWMIPSGQVGSIGVFAVHMDESAALEAEGVKPTVVSAGKYKAEGLPYVPLSDAAQAALQEKVDGFYQAMVKDIASYRGVAQKAVRDGFGEGRTVTAQAALAEGMVDAVGTMEQMMQEVMRLRPKKGAMSAQLAAQRLKVLEA